METRLIITGTRSNQFNSAVVDLISLIREKDAAYSGEVMFGNMRNQSFGIQPEQMTARRIADKIARLDTLMSDSVYLRTSLEGSAANAKEESIEDTVLDIAGYALILATFIRERRTGAMDDLRMTQARIDILEAEARDEAEEAPRSTPGRYT